MKSERHSNMELLRIVAMLMIVAYHIYCHCVSDQLNDGNNTLFNVPYFFKKLMILATLAPLGKIGDVIFVIISGYFTVSKGENINLTNIAKKLLSQQGYATIIIVISSTVLFNHFYEIENFNPTLFNINYFNNCNWFIGYYFAIIVFAKLFLNKFIEKLDKEKYTMFVLAIFAFTQFSWTVGILNGFSNNLEGFVTGVFLYSLGGYIKRFNPFGKIRLSILLLIILLAFLFVIQSNYNQALSDIAAYNGTGFYKQNIIQYSDYNIVPIIVGISIFEVFRRINIPNAKIVNFLGASTLMVYLVHDNKLSYSFWKTQDWITLLYNNPLQYIAKHFLWTVLTFLAGVLAYTFYVLLSKIFIKIKPLVIKE